MPHRTIDDLEELIDKVLLATAHQQTMSGFYLIEYSLVESNTLVNGHFIDVDTDFSHMLGYQKQEMMKLKPNLTTHPDWYADVIWSRKQGMMAPTGYVTDEASSREKYVVSHMPMRWQGNDGSAMTVDTVGNGLSQVAYYKMMLSKEGRSIKTQVLWAMTPISASRGVSFCYARKIDEFPYRDPPVQPYEYRALKNKNVERLNF